MKKKTEALARKIAGEGFLNHFLLVGGTALPVYLEHRLSEDLDFATTERQLPRKAISGFLNRLSKDGCVVEDILPMAERQYAENEGCDIDDLHQDWSIDGVKLTFLHYRKKWTRETSRRPRRKVVEELTPGIIGNTIYYKGISAC